MGDLFEITFNGGAAGTQLTELKIDTDKMGDGLTIGDCLFDTAPADIGASVRRRLRLSAKPASTRSPPMSPTAARSWCCISRGFDPGEKLVFTIDVDEQGFLGPNAVAEGNEFEGSKLTGFIYRAALFDTSGSDIFYDAFDGKLSGIGLGFAERQLQSAQPIYA